MRSILPLTLALLALLAGPAGAATVHVDVVHPPQNPKFQEAPYATVIYSAAAGEANVVDIGEDAAGAIVLTESGGAPLTAHSGCNQQAPDTVVCPVVRGGLPEFRGVVAWLRDGDDRLTTRTRTQAYGGEGSDALSGLGTLYGEAGDDVLAGSERNDELRGGEGNDRLSGGAGDDIVHDEGGDDALDGGDGKDTLTVYSARGFTVDLAAGMAAEGLTRDTLASFERVLGGDGPDTLLGSERGEELSGGMGDDVLDGRGGDDLVDGGSGRDRVRGGDGDDRLRFSAQSCGGGEDAVDGDVVPSVPADCERVLIDDFPFHAGLRAVREPVRWRRAGIAFAFECPADATSACHVRPIVRRGKTLVASAPRSVRIARGRTATVSLKVTKAGRRLLGAGHRFTVRDSRTGHGWQATYAAAQ
jgi:Ca2+-binding RTX toxin-like protein